jgi:acyl-CoA-binding protein
MTVMLNKILFRKDQKSLLIGVAVAVAAASTAVVIWRMYYRCNTSTSNRKRLPDQPVPSVPATVWKAFLQSVEKIESGKVAVKTGDKLLLYAIYKQVTIGDAPKAFVSKPGSWNVVVEKTKYNAWCRMRGMSRSEAAVHYITAVAALQECEDGSNTDEDEDEMQRFGSPVVSRPEPENGGYGDAITSEALLLAAAGDNDVEKVREMLGAGVHVDFADESGQTALHLAADRGSIECLKVLLEIGANPLAADKDGISVLQAAVISGHVEACVILLDHGADPGQEDLDGDTPVSCAMDDGSPAFAKLFNFEI